MSVSVIITCFNLELYVGEAIESVLAQDFTEPVEIIVVDDCSTDGSADAIRRYKGACYLKTEQNGGVLLATLAGIDAASHDLVFFLDGDDLWEPRKLASCVARFARSSKVGFVTHDLSYIDQDGRPLDRVSRVHAVLGETPEVQIGDRLRQGILEVDNYVWLGSAFGIRKSAIDYGGFRQFALALPDPRNTYQDWPLAFWIAAQRGVELAYVPEKLFRYRLHQLNHSGDASTPERAIRNLVRTRNTNRAMLDIARQRGLPREIIAILTARDDQIEYLIALTRGRRIDALRRFVRVAPDFRRRRLFAKELARLLAVQALGPARFARLAGRRKFLRDMPAT